MVECDRILVMRVINNHIEYATGASTSALCSKCIQGTYSTSSGVRVQYYSLVCWQPIIRLQGYSHLFCRSVQFSSMQSLCKWNIFDSIWWGSIPFSNVSKYLRKTLDILIISGLQSSNGCILCNPGTYSSSSGELRGSFWYIVRSKWRFVFQEHSSLHPASSVWRARIQAQVVKNRTLEVQERTNRRGWSATDELCWLDVDINLSPIFAWALTPANLARIWTTTIIHVEFRCKHFIGLQSMCRGNVFKCHRSVGMAPTLAICQ